MQGVPQSSYAAVAHSPEGTLDRQALKSKYLECLAAVSTVGSTLRSTVLRLVSLGVRSHELVAWAADAGYPKRQVRKILSRILLQAGVRRRRRGSGPKMPPEALAIVANVRSLYGRRATRFLRAALRLAKTQDDAESAVSNGLQNESDTAPKPAQPNFDQSPPVLIPDQDKTTLHVLQA
jgi:hypothetical protein